MKDTFRLQFTVYLLFCSWAVLSFFAGCSDDQGTYALWNRFTHPEGFYSFYYLSPPWTRHSKSTDVHPVMIVDNYDNVTEGGLTSRVRLEAWYDEYDDAIASAVERVKYWRHEGYEVDRIQGHVNYRGDVGYAVRATYGSHRAQEVFFDFLEGSVFFSVWSNDKSAMADNELLLDSFAPGNFKTDEQ